MYNNSTENNRVPCKRCLFDKKREVKNCKAGKIVLVIIRKLSNFNNKIFHVYKKTH